MPNLIWVQRMSWWMVTHCSGCLENQKLVDGSLYTGINIIQKLPMRRELQAPQLCSRQGVFVLNCFWNCKRRLVTSSTLLNSLTTSSVSSDLAERFVPGTGMLG